MYLNHLFFFSILPLSLFAISSCTSKNNDDLFYLSANPNAGADAQGGNVNPNDSGNDSGNINPNDSSKIELDGFLLDVPLTPETSCATGSMKVERSPLYIQFVLDGSGSMGIDGKWAALLQSVGSLIDRVTLVPDPKLAIGISMFCDGNDPSCDGDLYHYPSSADVKLTYADSTLKQLWLKRIKNSRPVSITPTYPALIGGYEAVENYNGGGNVETGGKKIVVLVTDGMPSTTGGRSYSEELNACKTVAAQKRSTVPLFVIGIGVLEEDGDYDPVFLAELAQSGGTAKPGCQPSELADENKTCHFQITPGPNVPVETLTDKLIGALDQIRYTSIPCTLQISPNGSQKIDPANVNVIYTDSSKVSSTVFKDEVDGWTYDDPTDPKAVLLHGQACDNAKKVGSEYNLLLGCQSETAH